jgi:hypothetical protein
MTRIGTRLLCAALLLSGGAVVAATPAQASCLASPGEQAQYDRAEAVVEGTFGEGPTDRDGRLMRPAAFDVARYVKGSGPSRLAVQAGPTRRTDGSTSLTSVDITPRAGETWRLYGRPGEREFETSQCTGSRQIVTAYAAACPPDVPEDGYTDLPPYDVHEPAVDCATWRGTRAQIASMLAAALKSTGTTLPTDPFDAFDDDEGSPHELAIDQLAELGVVRGTGFRTFAPVAPVARAQVAALLVRAQEQDSGEPLPVTRDHFTDDTDSPHELQINKAADARYVAGTRPDLFSPDALATRSQLATVLVRWIDLRVR